MFEEKKRGLMVMKKKKIFIVDDDAEMRYVMRGLLSLENKYEFDEASDGEQAMKKVESFSPDLIILDVKMPKKEGFKVCFTIRQNREMKNVKIIGVSGITGDIGDTIMGALGVDYFFEKPFEGKLFRRKAEELLTS